MMMGVIYLFSQPLGEKCLDVLYVYVSTYYVQNGNDTTPKPKHPPGYNRRTSASRLRRFIICKASAGRIGYDHGPWHTGFRER